MNWYEQLLRYLGGEFGAPQAQAKPQDQLQEMLAKQRAFEMAQAADAQRRMAQQQGQPGEVGWNGVVDPRQIIGYLTGGQ